MINECETAVSRRTFLGGFGAGILTPLFAGLSTPSSAATGALRRQIVESPVAIALHRAKTFTRVFRENEDKPWMVRKAMALREYFRTVPLYLRQNDRIAGSITEVPGAMPVIAEIGIGENSIYTGENENRRGYLRGQIPADIWDYWKDRNLWGLCRAENPGASFSKPPRGPSTPTQYKFICNQGHLSPSYGELLRTGLRGAIEKVRQRRRGESDPESLAFLTAAEYSLTGVADWARRYAEFLSA